jgi:peroxiredoxin
LLFAGLPLAQAAKPLAGRAAPDFVGKTLQGRNVRLSEHAGEVVLVGFWTSWCSTCREQLERLEKLHATYKPAGLIVIGVNLDDDRTRAQEVVTATRLTFPVLFDSTKDVSRRYDVSNVPMLVLVDRSGVVRYVHGEMKGRDEGDLIAEIRALLDE